MTSDFTQVTNTLGCDLSHANAAFPPLACSRIVSKRGCTATNRLHQLIDSFSIWLLHFTDSLVFKDLSLRNRELFSVARTLVVCCEEFRLENSAICGRASVLLNRVTCKTFVRVFASRVIVNHLTCDIFVQNEWQIS